MSKLKENLEFQKETNNVIETLMKHFGEEKTAVLFRKYLFGTEK